MHVQRPMYVGAFVYAGSHMQHLLNHIVAGSEAVSPPPSSCPRRQGCDTMHMHCQMFGEPSMCVNCQSKRKTCLMFCRFRGLHCSSDQPVKGDACCRPVGSGDEGQ